MEFINLKKQYGLLKPDIDQRIQNIMADARFIGGPEVTIFEEALAGYTGRKHCISCGSGTDALLLACMAYGIGKGDEVFCPDMTFIASIEPACLLGAEPVFVDIDPVSYNMSPSLLEEEIKRVIKEGRLRPKAVIMVDFLGNPADADAIGKICETYGLLLAEDAAQAVGAVYKGRMCGSLGDISCTSFFPSKPLGCYGDGGAVFTDDDDTAALIRSYKVHGKGSSKFDNVRTGINSRLDTIQAAVLLAKLKVLDQELEKRQEVAARYDKAFAGILQVPQIAKGCRSAYAQYVLLADHEDRKKKIVRALEEEAVPWISYYPKELHRMDAFGGGQNREMIHASEYAGRNFGIPFSPYLTTEEQDVVIGTICKACGQQL